MKQVAKFSWELMSVIEFSLMSIELDPFNENKHTDLMIPMYSR